MRYEYKPQAPSWKRDDNRMVWAAIGLIWFLLCIDALTKI